MAFPNAHLLSNGINITFVRQQEEFLGIGAVSAAGVELRSAARPMFVEIRNPWGVELLDYRMKAFCEDGSGVRLTFAASRQERGIMEWMVHSVRNRYVTADWTRPAVPADGTTLEMILRPVERHIAGRRWIGFSYQYQYKSKDIPIYKILDRGTWELQGTIMGSEFWLRNCFVPSQIAFTDESQFYSSEWYLPTAANPSIFQFLPLQTELQGFTFTSGPAGTLITWATRAAHIRSLFEKPRGSGQMVHWHEHCGDLATEFATAPVEVLWLGGLLDRVERFNVYQEIRETVFDHLHRQIGMKRERVSTYGLMEEWGPADLDRYRTQGAAKLLAAGVKKIGLANHCSNNMNVWGVSNMCCTVDYKIPESVGEDKLQALCKFVQTAGAKVEMWGNTSLSVLTEIFRNRNGPTDRIRFLPTQDSVEQVLAAAQAAWVRNPSNAIEADHYTPVFAVLNLRDKTIRDYWMRRWREFHDRIGLEGIFLDSSFNLSSDKFHWVQNAADQSLQGATADQTGLLGNFRPAVPAPGAILSQYAAHLELIAAMQRDGFEYCNEDLGVFGIHRHGPSVDKRIDSLPIWADCLVEFDGPAIARAGRDPWDIFFRGLAYRMVWMIFWDVQQDALSFHYGSIRGPDDIPTAAHEQLLKAFNEVEADMLERKILPNEAGVAYRSPNRLIVWAFAEIRLSLERSVMVIDVLAGTEQESASPILGKHGIYKLPPEAIIG